MDQLLALLRNVFNVAVDLKREKGAPEEIQ